MISARVRLNSTSEWAQAIKNAAWPEIQEIADELARSAEKHVRQIVSSEYSTGVRSASGTRRRSGLRLRNSFQARAFPSPGASVIQVVLTTRPGANLGKVGALNYGSGGHEIPGNPRLVFEGTHGITGTVVVPKVNHPGTTGARFMERAINLAVQEITGMRRR